MWVVLFAKWPAFKHVTEGWVYEVQNLRPVSLFASLRSESTSSRGKLRCLWSSVENQVCQNDVIPLAPRSSGIRCGPTTKRFNAPQAHLYSRVHAGYVQPSAHVSRIGILLTTLQGCVWDQWGLRYRCGMSHCNSSGVLWSMFRPGVIGSVPVE